MHYLRSIQFFCQAGCHGYVAGLREMNRVGAEEFQQFLWFGLHRVHYPHQHRGVEDLCPLQSPGVNQVPQQLAQVPDVVAQFRQIFLPAG